MVSCKDAHKQGLMKEYDSSAFAYENLYRDEQEAKITEVLSNIVLIGKEVVLDLGCGTGLLFKHLKNKTKKVFGVDFSKEMLRRAKRKAEAVYLLRSDADFLPFPDNIFNVVFAVTLLQNMPCPYETIIEIRRVSKPEALIIITALKKRFTTKKLETLLQNSKLRCEIINKKWLRGLIAICRNPTKKS